MKSYITIFFFLIAVNFSGAQAQNRAGAFAAAATPGQVPVPAAAPPQLTIPLTPGVPRPATLAQPSQQQQEQLRVVADPSTNSLIIYGTAQEYQNVKNILKELDAIPRQVLLDVMVAEVTLTDDESFGVAYELFRGPNSIFGQTFLSTGAIGGVIPAPSKDSLGNIITTAITGFPPGISGIIGRTNTIRAFINALASQNRIKALASPSVLATDNRPARIQVGSEIPILTGQTSTFTGTSTPLTSNAIQYRNTGVILTVIPQINSQGLVNLQLKQEVSDVGSPDFGSTGSPSFTTRDAETNAVVQDGDTLAIGGIIGERKTRDRSGVPYLMDLPVFGRFFGTTADHSTRTELVILITPHVIRNKDESQFVTQDLKNKLSDVKNELERVARERAKSQQPAPPPPLPDPNQYYQHDQQQPAPANPPAGSRTSLPSAVGNVMMFTNDPNAGRIMPPIAVQQESNPGSLAQTQPVAMQSYSPPSQSAAPALPASPAYIMSFKPAPAVAAPAAPAVPASMANSQKSTTPRRFWTVQVAAIGESSAAESLAQNLRRLGYDAYVRVIKTDNKTWHRVRVGQLENQKDAADLRKTLSSDKEHKDAFIVRY
jgi:Flp pilus assembly secretin CpaC